jgi:hypothetical protein
VFEAVGHFHALSVFGVVLRDFDPELIAPRMPGDVEGVGADVVVPEDFMMTNVAEQGAFDPAAIVGPALQEAIRKEIAIKGPRFDGKWRTGASDSVVDIDPQLTASAHNGQGGQLGLTPGQAP